MKTIKKVAVAALLLIPAFNTNALGAPEKFTAKKFLEWKESNRRSYIQTTLQTANIIANGNDEEQSECLKKWYFSDQEGRANLIYSYMEKHSDFHPIGVIIAVFEKQCGEFIYK